MSPGQPVRFTVHQSHAVTIYIKSTSSPCSSCASSYYKRSIYRLCFVKAPDTGLDFGRRVERGPPHKNAFMELHAHRLASVCGALN